MTKKLLSGRDALIGGETKPKAANEKGGRGRPRKHFTPDHLPEDENRASIIVKKTTWERFKALGYWQRRKQKTLLDEILTEYMERWEKKNGAIKQIPADADI